MKDHFGCPVQATSNVISGKWKVLILWHLSFESLRFAEIRDRLPGVSEKMLTAQLRQLETDGLVHRTVTESNPPRVDYTLADAGRHLIPVMDAMWNWGATHLGIDADRPLPPQARPAAMQPG
jgi:DNA-binding HxlR family transcriptional regulator